MTKTFYKTKLALSTIILIVLGASKNYSQLGLNLTGTGNFVSTTYQINNGGFTVEYDMFIYAHQNFNAGVSFVCSSPGNTPGPVDFYFNSTGNGNMPVGNCSGFSAVNSSPVSSGTWHNIAYRYTGGAAGIQLYIDGILIGTSTGFGVSPAGPYSATGFRIGDRVDGLTNAEAKFDNVRIWSIARTPAQIVSDITACFTGNEPGLDILYKMEEGSGTTIIDAALGNGAQNGSITGVVSWTSGTGSTNSSSTINETACTSYTSPSGNYTWTNSGTYLDTIPNIYGCDSNITINLTIQTVANDQSVSASVTQLCSAGSSDINIDSSETGFSYILRDHSTNIIVDGPYTGNGSPITFNTGTISSTTTYNVFTFPTTNGSLNFDGIDNWVSVGQSGSYSGNYTIEAWVKPNNNDPGSVISIAGSRGPGEFSFDIKLQNGNLIHGDIGNGFGWITTSADANFNYNVDQWYHIAYVVHSSGYLIYVDGNLVGNGSFGGTPLLFDSNHLLAVGNNSSSSITEPFDGLMDEFRVWNTIRSQLEIQNNMNTELTGTEPDLITYYNFNELPGSSSANDLSSSNFDGTLMNMDNMNDWNTNSPVSNSPCAYQLSDTITVHVGQSYINSETVTTCSSYLWNSNTYTETGVYGDTLTNVTGCDSINVLNLIINNVITNATISDDTLCISDNTTLNVTPLVTAPTYIGNPATIDVSDAYDYPCVYGNYYEGAKHQILILASELTALGMATGNINGMQFFVNDLNTLTDSLLGFNIKLAHTNVTDLSSGTFETTLFTNCYSSAYFKVDTGTTTHIFSTPFVWDGTSNIIIETCYNNNVLGYSYNPNMPYTTTAFASVIYYEDDGNSSLCSETDGSSSFDRPNFRLLGNTNNYNIAWSNPTGGIVNPTAVTTLAIPTASGQYMVVVTNTETGCSRQDTLDVWFGNPTVNLGADIVQPNPPVVLDAGTGFSSYNWSNSATTQTTSITVNGTYSVIVTDVLGCSDSDTIQVNFTTGISNSDGTNATASFYPNPTQNILNMQLDGFTDNKLNIEFIDINGKMIREFMLEDITPSYHTIFDLNGLDQGTYFIRISGPTTGISKQIMIVK